MKLPSNRGFGIGTLVVIIAIVLIIGAYMYYSGDKAPETTPATTETTLTTSEETAAPAMETGATETTGTPVTQ